MLSVSGPALPTLIILGVSIVLFLSGRVRPDLVALLVLAGLTVARVLTPEEALAGFGRSSVVTLLAIFVLAQGLLLTGASGRVGDLLARAGGSSEGRLVAIVMAAGAFLSLFMNNVAAASVLMPAVSGLAHRKGVYPSRLLMPLAFGTILGGTATLFTTVNLIVNGFLHNPEDQAFGVLDFAPVGVPVAAAGVVYVALWGRRRLPSVSVASRLAAARESAPDLAEVYRLGETLFRARIPAGSYLHGRRLADSTFRETYNINVVALERGDRTHVAPEPDTVLYTGDVLVLEGSLDEFRAKDVEPYLEILPGRAYKGSDLESDEIIVAEAILSPRSRFIGMTLRETSFRSRYGFTVLAIWRQGSPIRRGMASLPLEFGDALLLQGPVRRLPILQAERDLIVMSSEYRRPFVPRPERVWIAAGIVAAALAATAAGWLPTAESALLGCLALILTGCLSLDEAYGAIEWKSVFLLAGMLSMGVALAKTGLADTAASAIARSLEPYGAYPALVGLFVLSMLLTQVLGGPVTVAIVAPVAIEVARQLSASPRPFAMAVAMAASTAFLSPLGHPVNMLVMGPGGYRFSDYWRVGLPLSIVVSAVILVLLPLAWPLGR